MDWLTNRLCMYSYSCVQKEKHPLAGSFISRLAVDMKFPIHIHIHRRLSCVHVATKFSQITAGARWSIPQRQRHRHSPPKIVIIIWNCLRINTYLHCSMCFVKYFQNLYENRCNSNAPVFFRMQFAFISAWSGRLWCTFGFYFPLALKMLESKKETCAVD